MVWRRSSAMGAFLEQLAQVFRSLPPGLLALDETRAGPSRSIAAA